MTRQIFVAVGVGLPWLVCTLIPSLIFGVLLGQWGTNLIWGLVFGFGWWVAQSVGGPEHWRTAATIGFFVWPPIVLCGLYFISREIWKSEKKQRRNLFLLFLAISSVPLVPARIAMALYSNVSVPPDFNMLMASW